MKRRSFFASRWAAGALCLLALGAAQAYEGFNPYEDTTLPTVANSRPAHAARVPAPAVVAAKTAANIRGQHVKAAAAPRGGTASH